MIITILAIFIILLGIVLFIPALLPIKSRVGFTSKLAIIFVLISSYVFIPS